MMGGGALIGEPFKSHEAPLGCDDGGFTKGNRAHASFRGTQNQSNHELHVDTHVQHS